MRLAGGLLLGAPAALTLPAGSPSNPVQAQALCGTMTATVAPQHVIVVMLENRRFNQVIGNSAALLRTRWPVLVE